MDLPSGEYCAACCAAAHGKAKQNCQTSRRWHGAWQPGAPTRAAHPPSHARGLHTTRPRGNLPSLTSLQILLRHVRKFVPEPSLYLIHLQSCPPQRQGHQDHVARGIAGSTKTLSARAPVAWMERARAPRARAQERRRRVHERDRQSEALNCHRTERHSVQCTGSTCTSWSRTQVPSTVRHAPRVTYPAPGSIATLMNRFVWNG